MAKAKVSKGTTNVPNKAQYSRISFLYQAAAYLSTQSQQAAVNVDQKPEEKDVTIEVDAATVLSSKEPKAQVVASKQSQLILSDMRAVSQKMQIRLSPAMKSTICKRCNTLLVDGPSCTTEIENKSKNGNKPWADVLVRTCTSCGCQRRFPLAAQRQKRRPIREKEIPANTDAMDIPPKS